MLFAFTVASAKAPDALSLPLWSAVALVVAALIAALVGIFGHVVSRSNAKLQAALNKDMTIYSTYVTSQNAKLQASLTANLKLAEMRQTWINSLRDDMAAFQSLGMTPDLEHTKERDFYRLGTRIELYMNPSDPDFNSLQKSMYRLLEASSVDEKYSENPEFVSICQRILKREWDVLKKEIQSVTFSSADSPHPPELSTPAHCHQKPA